MNNIADSLRCIIVYPASSRSQQSQPLLARPPAEAGSEDRPRLLRRGRGGSLDLRRQRERAERERRECLKLHQDPAWLAGAGEA